MGDERKRALLGAPAQFLTQLFSRLTEGLGGNRCQQLFPVFEMPVGRGLRNIEPFGKRAEGDGVHPLALRHRKSRLDQCLP